MFSLTELILFVFLLNLPFGYYRVSTKKFSMKWFLSIHLPIPFIFVLRVISGFGYKVVPLLIVFDILGQVVGGKVKKILRIYKKYK
ncbi:MAG: hypothetical protein ACE5KT_09845 [Methanosarcinales archaeon]